MPKYNFINVLKNSKSEEEVKQAYIREFKIDATIRHAVDLRTENVLFEFKHDKAFAENHNGKRHRMQTLAQALYYVHRCKYGHNDNSVPNQIIIAEKAWAVTYVTKEWKSIYTNKSFDWDRTPSSPDPKLVEACHEHELTTSLEDAVIYQMDVPTQLHDFGVMLNNYITADNTPTDNKIVTDKNFETVYQHWISKIGEFLDVKDYAAYFLRDLQNKPFYDTEKGLLMFSFRGITEEFSIPPRVYKHFWTIYKRPPTKKVLETILAKADRLNNMDKRRFNGEFYTPPEFAQKGLDYIAKELGDDWYLTHKIWDMACGTGNLEYYIPDYRNVFMSTLDEDEVMHMNTNNLFPDATIFQYDYLNDDVELVMNPIPTELMGEDYIALLDDSLGWKLPRKLREELANPENKWVVLMNPPYADSGSGIGKGNSKAGVAQTKMKSFLNIGAASKELYTQFICRIKHEIPNVFLGIYSTLKYVNAPNHKKFRDNIFIAEYKNGFMFSASAFEGTSGKWPVAFLMWELGSIVDFQNQNIYIDILDDQTNHIGNKTITIVNDTNSLSKSIPRPKSTIYSPPLKGALNQYTGKIIREKLAVNSIGFMEADSNDIQNASQKTFFMSSVYGNTGGWSITPEIFEQTMIVNLVRKNIKATWTNNRDQFKQPSIDLPQSFINDCVLWSLFNGSNQSSSLKDVIYKDNTYQIKNEFYPFLLNQVEEWETNNSLRNEKERFVAEWLQDAELSKEAQDVLDIARQIYSLYYSEIVNLNHRKFKLGNWDIGWYQIRNSLKDAGYGANLFADLAVKYNKLTTKLKPAVYDYGFLDKEELF